MGAARAAEPPAQPKAGFGGQDYVTASVVKKAYGEGSAQAFVFHPAEASEKARPVVVLVHGFGAVSPKWYGAWINHLARKGNIVIYPKYQEPGGFTKLNEVTGEAAKGIKRALDALAETPGAHPDLARVAFAGHAAGALIAANLAARAGTDGLPAPRLVYAAMATKVPTDAKTRAVALTDLSSLDPQTNFIVVTADRDTVAGETGARAMLRASAGALKAERRLLVRIQSDNHGQPVIAATHYGAIAPDNAFDLPQIEGAVAPKGESSKAVPSKAAPMDKAAREQARKDVSERWWLNRMEQTELAMMEGQITDTFDIYGLWRTLDLTMSMSFAGATSAAIRAEGHIFEMGEWSDGWPVKRLHLESPKDTPAVPAIASPKN